MFLFITGEVTAFEVHRAILPDASIKILGVKDNIIFPPTAEAISHDSNVLAIRNNFRLYNNCPWSPERQRKCVCVVILVLLILVFPSLVVFNILARAI
jgi:hypothetical protein